MVKYVKFYTTPTRPTMVGLEIGALFITVSDLNLLSVLRPLDLANGFRLIVINNHPVIHTCNESYRKNIQIISATLYKLFSLYKATYRGYRLPRRDEIVMKWTYFLATQTPVEGGQACTTALSNIKCNPWYPC
jgi:hypothetical protein